MQDHSVHVRLLLWASLALLLALLVAPRGLLSAPQHDDQPPDTGPTEQPIIRHAQPFTATAAQDCRWRNDAPINCRAPDGLAHPPLPERAAQPQRLDQPAVLRPLYDMVHIATGGYHTCGLTRGGGIQCWGNNGDGQLGDGTTFDHSTPVAVFGLSNSISAVTAGSFYTCALTTLGGIKCWGRNSRGQLGDGTTTRRLQPVDVTGLSSGISAVFAGDAHTCALTTLGSVKCWGWNEYGQLGDGSLIDRYTPVDVPGLSSGVKAIAVGSSHTCALTTLGGVKCWGRNEYGQLGNGTEVDQLQPVDVVGLTSGVSALAIGWAHTCALLTSGSVQCWGANYDGQLGDGTTTTQLTPKVVTGLGSGVSAIASGWSSMCALIASGSVKCWGNNEGGQLGDGTTTNRLTPVDVIGVGNGVTAIAASQGGHTCGLLSTGGIKCWGRNGWGQLGDGRTLPGTLPVDVVGLSSGVSALSAGNHHTCAVIGGALQCWGENFLGELGDGTRDNRMTPVAVVGLSGPVSAVAPAGFHTCALLTSGGVQCWGQGASGELGDGARRNSLTPVTVIGLNGSVRALTAGGYGYTCALSTLGSIQCWGDNEFGQLGDGTTISRAIPVAVAALAGNGSALDAGREHTCAIINGGLKCWGNNEFGQLGDGSLLMRVLPVDVAGLTGNVSAVTVNEEHSCALTGSGGVKCWGSNFAGQLGDGTTIARAAPVDVVGLNSGVSAISAGRSYTCALMNSGSVKCWGSGYGSTPTDLSGISGGGRALVSGWSHTCLLTNGGGVKCWGSNFAGQLGDGMAWRTTPVDVVEEITCYTLTLTHTNAGRDPLATPTNSRGCRPSQYTAAEPITLYAQPDAGWRVASWTGADDSASTALTNTLTMPAADHAVDVVYTPLADAYETDDGCAQAQPVATDGRSQLHNFHQAADPDWGQIAATAGVTYVIEARVPPESFADLVLELYDNCASGAQQTQNHTFSPDIRLVFQAPATGPLFLRLLNSDPARIGPQTAYYLSVREVTTTPQVGALIIVGGRLRNNDTLQSNIDDLTQNAYRLWRANGYPPERIRFLSTNLALDADNDGVSDVAGLASQNNLRAAITEWAVDKVAADRALTLYLMDHGDYDRLYLDKPRNELLSVADLDGWLDQLEAQVPGLKVNIIVEACLSGSFIDIGESVSAPNRVVIASTSARALAWASARGAVFSDTFFTALGQGRSLYTAFQEAQWTAIRNNSGQLAWLDDNGDGIPNSSSDGQAAAQRSFATPGSLLDGSEKWAPYVIQAEMRNFADNHGEIWANVVDDETRVRAVWAVIYPPSYQPPSTSEELLPEPLPVALLKQANQWYGINYSQFDEAGDYRILVYAEDESGLRSRPRELQLNTGSASFLPFVKR